MMETWCLLKKDEKFLLPLPAFSLIIKLYPTKFPWCGISHLPTCKPHNHPILINHFLSTTLLLLHSSLLWDIKDYGIEALWSFPEMTPIGFIVRMDQFCILIWWHLFDTRYSFVSWLWCHLYESTHVIKLHKAIHIGTKMSACKTVEM